MNQKEEFKKYLPFSYFTLEKLFSNIFNRYFTVQYCTTVQNPQT